MILACGSPPCSTWLKLLLEIIPVAIYLSMGIDEKWRSLLNSYSGENVASVQDVSHGSPY